MVPYHVGDVDSSREITISDATLIQKYLADLAELEKYQQWLADVDSDGEVTVKDVTVIQKYLADIDVDFNPNDKYCTPYVHIDTFIADCDSSVAASGDEVTFMAYAYPAGCSYPRSVNYEFKVNDVTIANGDESQASYTFTQPGTYKITVVCTDYIGIENTYTTDYVVSDDVRNDELYVRAFYYDYNLRDGYDHESALTAIGAGGSGEYEYQFVCGTEVLQDFSDVNTCEYPEWGSEKWMSGYVKDSESVIFTVNIRDKASGEVVSADVLENAYYVIY